MSAHFAWRRAWIPAVRLAVAPTAFAGFNRALYLAKIASLVALLQRSKLRHSDRMSVRTDDRCIVGHVLAHLVFAPFRASRPLSIAL
jgi:hypothetical protein